MGPRKERMKIWICSFCGHLALDQRPVRCPVCQGDGETFQPNDQIFSEVDDSPVMRAQHKPVVTVQVHCPHIHETDCVEVTAKVGEALHPMEEGHAIVWVDFYVDNGHVSRVVLSPECHAVAGAYLNTRGTHVTAVARCNLHGYWMGQNVIPE